MSDINLWYLFTLPGESVSDINFWNLFVRSVERGLSDVNVQRPLMSMRDTAVVDTPSARANSVIVYPALAA